MFLGVGFGWWGYVVLCVVSRRRRLRFLYGDCGESVDVYGDFSGVFYLFFVSLNGVLFFCFMVEEFFGGEGWYDVFVEEFVGERWRREEEFMWCVWMWMVVWVCVGVIKWIVDVFEVEEVFISD